MFSVPSRASILRHGEIKLVSSCFLTICELGTPGGGVVARCAVEGMLLVIKWQAMARALPFQSSSFAFHGRSLFCFRCSAVRTSQTFRKLHYCNRHQQLSYVGRLTAGQWELP